MAHNYDVGTRVWQPDPSEGWVASEVESKNIQGDKVKLVFALANGDVGALMALQSKQKHQANITLVENLRDDSSCITG